MSLAYLLSAIVLLFVPAVRAHFGAWRAPPAESDDLWP
jgi:hypothetical protein